MNVVNYPTAYQTAFRAAPFLLGDVTAHDGLDVSVVSAADRTVLGVKRIYGKGEIAVNAAPYVRSLLMPSPLCGQSMGMASDERRCASCRITVGTYTSAAVYLTAGTEDAPANTILSASSRIVKIREGEKDEISVISAGVSVKPFVVFLYEGIEYSMNLAVSSGMGMHTFVVDAAEVTALFTELTNAEPSEMREFRIMLRVATAGSETYLTRYYEFDSVPHNGRRLAWVNRYGAVDYYTFPTMAAHNVCGKKRRIATEDGLHSVATSAEESLTLVSEYETAETLGWLAEILSSPCTWLVEGGSFTAVDVADASAGFDPMCPGNLTVKVNPVLQVVSRKF